VFTIVPSKSNITVGCCIFYESISSLYDLAKYLTTKIEMIDCTGNITITEYG